MPQVTQQKWQSPKSANWKWTRCHIPIFSRYCHKLLLPFWAFEIQTLRMLLRLSILTFLRNHRFDWKSRKIAFPPCLYE
jgi:hypothetical protein